MQKIPKKFGVNELEDYNYMPENARKANLLDIKYVKHLKLEKMKFKDLYFASYEIFDKTNTFRPYVLLFTKDVNGKLVEIGYGYDTNNNGNVELFIKSFNYPVFLTEKGLILLPLTNEKEKIDVYDYITDKDIEKLEKQISKKD